MMDPKRWTKTLPATYEETNHPKYDLDPSRWVGTIPKIKTIKTKSPIKKYSLTFIFFIFGLILVSVTKNETRNLQKEIDGLQASINILEYDLHQETLDHEVISSPENISRLAKEHLESTFAHYTQAQIKHLNGKKGISKKPKKTYLEKNLKENIKYKKDEIKLLFAKKIEFKKTELMKLQELYSKPEELPGVLKKQVAKKIKAKKNELMELKKLYSEPGEIWKSKKVQQWAGLQVVKVFLGIPIVPGR